MEGRINKPRGTSLRAPLVMVMMAAALSVSCQATQGEAVRAANISPEQCADPEKELEARVKILTEDLKRVFEANKHIHALKGMCEGEYYRTCYSPLFGQDLKYVEQSLAAAAEFQEKIPQLKTLVAEAKGLAAGISRECDMSKWGVILHTLNYYAGAVEQLYQGIGPEGLQKHISDIMTQRFCGPGIEDVAPSVCREQIECILQSGAENCREGAYFPN